LDPVNSICSRKCARPGKSLLRSSADHPPQKLPEVSSMVGVWVDGSRQPCHNQVDGPLKKAIFHFTPPGFARLLWPFIYGGMVRGSRLLVFTSPLQPLPGPLHHVCVSTQRSSASFQDAPFLHGRTNILSQRTHSYTAQLVFISRASIVSWLRSRFGHASDPLEKACRAYFNAAPCNEALQSGTSTRGARQSMEKKRRFYFGIRGAPLIYNVVGAGSTFGGMF